MSTTTGIDLAREALAAARLAAASRGERSQTRSTSKRSRRVARGDGREPLQLPGALKQLFEARGWAVAAAGAKVIEHWETIATPEVAERLRPLRFDEATGCLELVPDSSAWTLQGKLISAKLLQRANEELRAISAGSDAPAGTSPGNVVREIRILAVGTRIPERCGAALDASQPTLPVPARALRLPEEYREARRSSRDCDMLIAVGSSRGREDCGPGFHAARAAIRATRPAPEVPPLDEPLRDQPAGYRQALAGLRPTAAPTPAHTLVPRLEPPAGYVRALGGLRASKVLSSGPA